MILRATITALYVIEVETCQNGCGTEIFELSENKGELYHGILYWPCCDEHERAGSGHGAWVEVYTCSAQCHDELQKKGHYET